MSDFSSLLASFKQSAASSAKRPGASSASPNRQQQQQTSRKRPHPGANVKAGPSFPSMHARKKGGFELSFLCIGAQKAGTTWLHTQLQKCPRLSLPVEQKEVHFWDWHWKRGGFDWYVRQFDYPPRMAKTDGDDPNPHNRLYGEITPCYVVLPPETIAEIRRCFPELKIVFVARDLVDRAWSALIMELRDQSRGLNPGEFADGTGGSSKRAKKSNVPAMSVAQQRRIQQQSSPASQTDSYYLDRLRSETHTSRSDYATYLRNWYEHFPAESILIVDYREIECDPKGLLLKIVMHIGVKEEEANLYVERLSDEEVRRRVNVATNAKSDGGKGNATATSQHSLSERPRLRKQMEQYLRPYAARFNSLLKEKGYSWKVDDYTK